MKAVRRRVKFVRRSRIDVDDLTFKERKCLRQLGVSVHNWIEAGTFLRMRAYNGYSENDRRRAQAWLNRQWQTCVLARPVQCVACGQDKGIIEAHAEDYSEPFAAGKTDQFHLCFTCHLMVHCRFRHPDDWRYYKAVIRRGGRYAPVFSRNIGGFRAKHIGGKRPLPDYQGEFRQRPVLEEIDQARAERKSSKTGKTGMPYSDAR